MRYDDFFDLTGKPAELSFHPKHLPFINTAALDRESSGRINAGNRDLIVEVEGLQVIGNIPLISVKSTSKSCINVVQRNVMISRHNDLRCWKRLQERTGSFELMRPGTLRKIAGNGHYVRLDLVNRMNQLLDDSVIGSAEVDIGKMDYGSNAVSFSGTMTRKAAGRVR